MHFKVFTTTAFVGHCCSHHNHYQCAYFRRGVQSCNHSAASNS